MKIILLKKIYSFILLICGFFFLTHSDLMAQCGPCSGNNKVRITKITYSCPYGCEICQTKCIQEDLLQKYYEQGWILGSGCRGHGCGGNQVINQLHAEALPLTVSIDPSSNSSIISFSLSQSGKVSLKVFDITDDGGWFANSSDKVFYSANCGRSKDYVVLNSGPIVTFRADNVVLNFKDFSIREIKTPL